MKRSHGSPQTLAVCFLFLSGLGAVGCGRSGFLGDNGGPNPCPLGQIRNGAGACVPLPDGGGPWDFSGPGPNPDFTVGPSNPDFTVGPSNPDLTGVTCIPTGPEVCNNGIDDDCNGLTDCQDPACSNAPNCQTMVDGGGCQPTGPEICTNRIDDDCNGLTDCQDPSCSSAPNCTCDCRDAACNAGKNTCPKGIEICNNGIDDDHNGLTDCRDPACLTFPGCQMMHMCNPQMPDCHDPACKDDPHCKNIVCKPTVDFGTLAQYDAKSTRTVDTTGTVDVAVTPCAPGGGGMVVTEFTVASDATAVKLDFTQATNSDHVFALFQAGVNERCDANPLACFDPYATKPPASFHTFALNRGHYYLIVQPHEAQRQGSVTVTLSTPPSSKKEICNNGIDDDMNGLTDCQDPACFKDPSCINKECNPDANVGSLVLGDPPKMASFDSKGLKGRYTLACAGGGGADYAIQFHMPQPAGVLMNWDQTGDHVVELFKKPAPGQNCDAISLGCYDPSGRMMDTVAWNAIPPGDYIFIFQAIKPGREGHVDVQLSAFANKKVEICHNGIDDDMNGLTDCMDPACFADPGCGPTACMPDVNLGHLQLNGPGKTVTLDTRNGQPNEITTCAKGGGRSRIVQVTLDQNAGMGFDCRFPMQHDHVLGLFAEQGPRDSCDKLEIDCGDPQVIPFGCNYEIPNLQPGTYYIIVEAFQSGWEDVVQLTLSAIQDRALEICNNGIDDDMDGYTDCMDRKCATSPYCISKACKPAQTIDPMPVGGMPPTSVFKLLQTAGTQVTAQPSCETKPGGGDAVVFINLPAQATLSVGYAQLGQHVFAMYPVIATGTVCDATKAIGCIPSMAMNNSGMLTFPKLAAGKYYFVAAADKPGDEGSVSLKFTATP